jgi:hypothetical protein
MENKTPRVKPVNQVTPDWETDELRGFQQPQTVQMSKDPTNANTNFKFINIGIANSEKIISPQLSEIG